MSIKHLYEDERPSLLLDFANSKTLDPRITFTRNSIGTYVDEMGIIRTAADNEARFDHDPATGECLGLLIEEGRTNLIANSQVFATGYTVANFTPPTDNVAVAPDGTTTAASIFETAVNDAHFIHPTLPSQTTVSDSVFVKPVGRDNVCLRCYATTTDWYTITFNLTGDGSITQETHGSGSNWTIRYKSITAFPNGWYRIAVSAISFGTVYPFVINGCTSSTPVLNAQYGSEYYSGDTNKGYYVWGAQVEPDSFPTSYIPTSGSTYQRLADEYVFNDPNVFGSKGTFIVDATVFAELGNNLQNQYIFTAMSANINNSVSITAGSGYSFMVYPNATFTGLVNYPAYTSGVRVTTAGAYAPGPSGSSSADVAFASDGAIRSTNVATGGSTTPTGMYQMYLFRRENGVASSLASGYLHKLVFYPTRLPNSVLEELTK